MLLTAMEPTSPVPLRILLAEDDAGLAKLYATFAKGRGHSVSFAQDGIETLSAALSELPDVILLDVQMPALDGRRTRGPPRFRCSSSRRSGATSTCAISSSSSAPPT
jgi:PleD family two-component response regulator